MRNGAPTARWRRRIGAVLAAPTRTLTALVAVLAAFALGTASPATAATDTGFDSWGYNYGAHLFNGYYCDAYHDAAWCQAYASDKLIMKWNDAYLSSRDLNGDGLRDRHFGFDSYIGSGAWLTNHMAGSYEGADGQVCTWTSFTKIVAVPSDAVSTEGLWYTADGSEIGSSIWDEFAIIEDVVNDPCAGFHGVQYVSPTNAGLGAY